MAAVQAILLHTTALRLCHLSVPTAVHYTAPFLLDFKLVPRSKAYATGRAEVYSAAKQRSAKVGPAAKEEALQSSQDKQAKHYVKFRHPKLRNET